MYSRSPRGTEIQGGVGVASVNPPNEAHYCLILALKVPKLKGAHVAISRLKKHDEDAQPPSTMKTGGSLRLSRHYRSRRKHGHISR